MEAHTAEAIAPFVVVRSRQLPSSSVFKLARFATPSAMAEAEKVTRKGDSKAFAYSTKECGGD